MGTELVKVNIPTPVLNVIDKTLSAMLQKNLGELEDDINKAIEVGVKTHEAARHAESIVQNGRKAIKTVNEIRLNFTRPIDQAKRELMDEVERLLRKLVESTAKLDGMVMEREAKLKAEEAARQRQAEEAQRAAEEAARKEQERRKNISISKGGDGKVEQVVPEQVAQPISTYKMHSTTKTRSIPDLVKIETAVEAGAREITGVAIYQVWQFKVTDSKKVPEEYRKDIRA